MIQNVAGYLNKYEHFHIQQVQSYIHITEKNIPVQEIFKSNIDTTKATHDIVCLMKVHVGPVFGTSVQAFVAVLTFKLLPFVPKIGTWEL